MLKNEINIYNDGIKCRRLYIVFSLVNLYSRFFAKLEFSRGFL